MYGWRYGTKEKMKYRRVVMQDDSNNNTYVERPSSICGNNSEI